MSKTLLSSLSGSAAMSREDVDNRRDISKFKLKIALILKTPRTFFTHVIRPFFITWVFPRIRGVLKKKTPRIPKKLPL